MPVTKKNQGLKIMKIRMLRNFVTVLSEWNKMEKETIRVQLILN
jgi:hypothetical protein